MKKRISLLLSSVICCLFAQSPLWANTNVERFQDYFNSLAIPALTDLAIVDTELSLLSGEPLFNAFNQIQPSMLGDQTFLLMHGNLLLAAMTTGHVSLLAMHNPPFCRQSVWFEPVFEYQERDTQGYIPGYDARTFGILNGADIFVNPRLSIGLINGFLFSDINWKNNFGYGESESAYIGLYGSFKLLDRHHSGFFMDASVVGNFSRYVATRNVTFGGLNRSAHSDHLGGGASGHFGAGYHYFLDEIMFTPFGCVDYIYQYEEGFTENNAGVLGLSFKSRDSNLLQIEAGSTFHTTFILENCLKVTPLAKLSWVHKRPVNDTVLQGNIINQPQFSITIFDRKTNHIAAELSLAMIYRDHLMSRVYYSGEYLNDFNRHVVGVAINHKF